MCNTNSRLNPLKVFTYNIHMKLKKTRKVRNCHSCKSQILKGDLYGQKSIALGSKENGQTETFDGMAVVVHQMRVPVSLCQECMEVSK